MSIKEEFEETLNYAGLPLVLLPKVMGELAEALEDTGVPAYVNLATELRGE